MLQYMSEHMSGYVSAFMWERTLECIWYKPMILHMYILQASQHVRTHAECMPIRIPDFVPKSMIPQVSEQRPECQNQSQDIIYIDPCVRMQVRVGSLEARYKQVHCSLLRSHRWLSHTHTHWQYAPAMPDGVAHVFSYQLRAARMATWWHSCSVTSQCFGQLVLMAWCVPWQNPHA